MKYSNRISELRKAAKLSQSELAERIGATLSMVGKLERGERKLTSSWIERLSFALNCQPADLLQNRGDALPQGDVMPGGWINWRDDPDSINEILRLYPDDGEDDWSSPELRDRSVVVAEQPISMTLPLGAQLVYDLSAGLLPLRLGELCLINVDAPDGDQVQTILGVLMQGTTLETFHILPVGGTIMMDQKVDTTIKISRIIL